LELIPEEIRKKLRKLGETDGVDLGKTRIPLKLFNPSGAGTWWLWEYDGEDTLFGICELFEKELGYASLSELKALRCPPFGLPLERDLFWDESKTAKDVLEGKV